MIGYAVLGGFVLDAVFGDPAWLPHPVVYMARPSLRWKKGCVPACPKRQRASFGAGAF